jgi:hypothetical protein
VQVKRLIILLLLTWSATAAYADGGLYMDVLLRQPWCGFGCHEEIAQATVGFTFPNDGTVYEEYVSGDLVIANTATGAVISDDAFGQTLSNVTADQFTVESTGDVYDIPGCFYAVGRAESSDARIQTYTQPQCFQACRLVVYIDTDGTWTSGGESGTYGCGDTVPLSASAYSGFEFDGWTGAVDSAANEITVTVDSALVEEVAHFSAWYDPPPPQDGGGDTQDDGGTCPQSQAGCTPIILNVGLGSYELTNASHGVNFDLDAAGVPVRTAWTAADSDEGFLVLDRNANGLIDDGAELFGSVTPLSSGGRAANGFQALASYDSDRNGAIDARDPVFAHLLLWFDRDHDGKTGPEELIPLSELGITSLGLDVHWVGRRDTNGNVLRYQALFHQGNRSRPYYDVLLAR